MNSGTSLWNFTELVPVERRQRLLAVTSFEEIIQGITHGNVDYFVAEPRQNYFRAFFKVRVSVPDYDAFFNSPNGYRAQYCLSTENGEKQNRRLIEAITPMCLEYSKRHEQHDFPTEKVLASLRGVDAKAWITESDIPDVDEVHINYGPWAAKAEASTKGPIADQAARAGASAGVLAPVGTHIEIKGAWLTPQGSEWRDPKKAFRAQEIRDYGFT
ncbi:MAG: hypothetical protein HY941_08060 [Gammaproteobacteria bacterium]|nr:hypothetical protein [Gammaproteobacteria bacterium]